MSLPPIAAKGQASLTNRIDDVSNVRSASPSLDPNVITYVENVGRAYLQGDLMNHLFGLNQSRLESLKVSLLKFANYQDDEYHKKYKTPGTFMPATEINSTLTDDYFETSLLALNELRVACRQRLVDVLGPAGATQFIRRIVQLDSVYNVYKASNPAMSLSNFRKMSLAHDGWFLGKLINFNERGEWISTDDGTSDTKPGLANEMYVALFKSIKSSPLYNVIIESKVRASRFAGPDSQVVEFGNLNNSEAQKDDVPLRAFKALTPNDKIETIDTITENNDVTFPQSVRGGGKTRRRASARRAASPAARKKTKKASCWKPTAQKVRCRDGAVRTLYANASKPGDWRVKRVRQLPRGKQEVRYVKPVV
jgi:hypothetical protein